MYHILGMYHVLGVYQTFPQKKEYIESGTQTQNDKSFDTYKTQMKVQKRHNKVPKHTIKF